MDIYNNRDGEEPRKNNKPNPEIYTIIAIVLCVFICVALLTNGVLFGSVGAVIVKFFLGVFGYAAYPLFIGALIFAVLKLFKKKIRLSKKHILAFCLMFLTGILSIHLFTTIDLIRADGATYGKYLGTCYTGAVAGFSTTTGGGVLSGLVVYPLARLLTVVGASIVFILTFLIATLIACDFLFLRGRKRPRRMEVSEYRDYPVEGRGYGGEGGGEERDYRRPSRAAMEARPYGEYREPQPRRPEYEQRPQYEPPREGLDVRPVQKKLYIGSVGQSATDFETKSRRELKNPEPQQSKLNLLYGQEPAPRQESPQWDKDSAKAMLFGAGQAIPPVPAEPDYGEQPPALSGQSYLDNFQQQPITDFSNPEARRNYILTPPSITDMYPNVGSKGGAEERYADPGRPRKIIHDKPVDYRQISIDEAIGSGDMYGAPPRRKGPAAPMYSVPERRPEGYEDYLNKKVPPAAPPIINGEEFTKRVLTESAPEPPLVQSEIITSADQLTDPTDKVVNFKKYSEKYAEKSGKREAVPQAPEPAPRPRQETREEPPEPVPPMARQTEQMRIPADQYTKPIKPVVPAAEQHADTADERARDAAAAVRKPVKPKYRYQAPPIDLIERRIMDLDSVNDSFNEKAKILEDTLEEFKVPAKVASIVKGPTVTRYELEMPRGVPVKRVLSVADDLAMRLESENGVRIEAPIPGKNRLGIEVPNSKKLMVGLREVLDTQDFYNSRSAIAFAVGKDVAGKNIVCDLAKMPHLLVAGSTGAGKSVCLNTLIVSLLYKSSPEDVRIILIDPKQVEFNTYNEMPHLMLREVISSPEKAISALNWAIIEMERRYTLFKAMGAVNLASYNDKYDPDIDEKLPYIVIIVDELADLMAINKREVEEKIQRLVQKSRAAGIHLVLATQRPSVDIITGVIKNNLPSRIAFKVVSYTDSKTILDGGGAENLLGSGDMLYKPASAPEPIRLQGAFISMDEVDNIVRYIKEHNVCDYDEAVEMIISKNEKTGSADASEDTEDDKDRDDPLFVDALRMVMDTKQASISFLQRKFSIGYARAGKLIDAMETMGYISPSDGSKARQVYITPQQFAEKYGELDG